MDDPVLSDGAAPAARQMSLGGAVFLGVGAMVGAGIFALLGEAGALAGSAVWISFLIGGVVAGLLGYAISKLSVTYPSRGGIVSYLHRSFGDGHLTGVASWLFYMAGLAVTTMVALSFGSYARTVVFDDDARQGWVKVFASLVIIAMALVNLVGADLVGKVQTLIVFVLLVVFAVFVVATFTEIDFDRLAPSTYPSVSSIVAAVALTFFAYLGFAVIANTAESLPQPSRNVPLATFMALAIAGGLYVLISLGVYGTMSVEDVIASGDTALAEAAKPTLGDAGFTMMAIAALLATASSVNANLFAAGGITANLAETRQFPSFFGGELGSLGGRGSVISVVVVLVLANFFDISTIASVGSAIALVIFGLVGVAAVKLRHEIGANPVVVGTGVLGAVVVLILFCIDTVRNEPRTFVSMIVVGVLAIAFDVAWRRQRNRVPASAAGASTTGSTPSTSTST